MRTYTKEDAIKLVNGCQNLVGKPLDQELRIKFIRIFPTGGNLAHAQQTIYKNGVTPQYIAESFGKGQNLLVMAGGSLRSLGFPSDVYEHIDKILPMSEIDEILKY